jgi:hypothetical protein
MSVGGHVIARFPRAAYSTVLVDRQGEDASAGIDARTEPEGEELHARAATLNRVELRCERFVDEAVDARSERLTEKREVEVVGGDAERQGVEPGVAARTSVPTIPG